MTTVDVYLGPTLEPITGQSLAFDVAGRAAGPRDHILHVSREGEHIFLGMIRLLWALLSLFFIGLRADISCVYFCSSRSRSGFLRDALLIIVAKAISRARIVNHLHGADFADFRERSSSNFRLFVDYVYKKVDVSIVPHDSMRDQYAAFPSMQIVAISNFISESFRHCGTTQYDKSPREIVFMSNLLKEKGIGELVEAVDRLVADGVAVNLTVAGKELRGNFAALMQERFGREYRAGKHIRFIGPVYGADKKKLLESSGLFVLPSYDEAFPISALEAANSGCVLILSNCRYMTSIFETFHVRFVPPRSTSHIYDALRGVVEGDRRMFREEGEKNRMLTTTAYHEDDFVECIERVMKGGEPRR